jgi:flagellar hook-associated protein 3 FlgL
MIRVTPQSSTFMTLFYGQTQMQRLGALQLQASSGKRYTASSDNPVATHAIGVLQRSLSMMQGQRARIDESVPPLNQSVNGLIETNQLVSRARQIALSSTQSFDSADRATLAAEVDTILKRVMAIANTQTDGIYLFSGQARDLKPFELRAVAGQPLPEIRYNGSSHDMSTVISDSISVDTAFAGDAIFLQGARRETLFLGNTGARPGTGTDSFVGRADLLVRNTGTTFSGVSGVANGTGSAGGDTIVGAMGTHSLLIQDTSGTGTSGLVALNNGQKIAWTSADQDLVVTGPAGEKIHLNMSSITAGFNSKIDVQGDGSLSVDGGLTSIPVDFSSNQTVIHSQTGKVLNVDSQNIRIAGVEPVEFTGTADIFTALQELRDDLLNRRGLPDGPRNLSLERRVADLDRIGSHLLDTIGTQSVALQDLDQLGSSNDGLQLDLKSRLAETESADLAAVIVEMQSLQTTIQFSFAAYNLARSGSLLDFLR